MLSLFPDLFNFPMFAYFILRIALAYYFGLIAKARMKKSYAFVAVFEVVVTIMVTIGLYTQGALLALMTLLIVESVIDRKENLFDRQTAHMRTILGCIALSLMFLGAGAFAFDLPL